MDKSDRDKLILVTGGTGFVGSYLIRYLLREGYGRIRAIRRADSRFDLLAGVEKEVEWVETDVLDIVGVEEAMTNVQQVYHCAALVSFDPGERDLMIRINRDGTANIVNAALHAGVEKLVHVSSIAAIGRDRKSNRVDEKTKWQRSPDNSYYAISKFQAEQEVWRGQAEGLRVAVVNPSVILGAGFWHGGTQELFNLAWREFPLSPVGASGFVDVRDVVRFMVRLMESDITGQRYILNAANRGFRQIQEEMAQALGRRHPRYSLSPILARWAARLDWLRSKLTGKTPLITRETALMTALSYEYDNHKSKRDFDFEYIPLSETIRETAALYRIAADEAFEPKTLDLR